MFICVPYYILARYGLKILLDAERNTKCNNVKNELNLTVITLNSNTSDTKVFF